MRIVQIGCGDHAFHVYADSLLNLKEEIPALELPACCDLNEDAARAYAERVGFARTYSDYAQMLDAERPDGVLVITAVPATPRIAAAVLRRGTPVYIEKPPGETLGEAEELLRLTQETCTPHQIAYNRRHMPLIEMLRTRMGDDFPVHIDYRMHRVRRSETFFHTTAVHGLDLVSYLMGTSCTEMRAAYPQRRGYPDGVVDMQLLLSYGAERTAALSFCPVSALVCEQLCVETECETYFIDLPVWDAREGGSLETWRGGTRVERVCPEETRLHISNGFYGEVKRFFDDVLHDTPMEDTLETAMDASILSECIRLRTVYQKFI